MENNRRFEVVETTVIRRNNFLGRDVEHTVYQINEIKGDGSVWVQAWSWTEKGAHKKIEALLSGKRIVRCPEYGEA